MALRHASVEVVSAFRATSVLDTPMRKLEVLEAADGTVIIRDTHYQGERADVRHVWLERHQADTLAKVIQALDKETPARGVAPFIPLNGNGHH